MVKFTKAKSSEIKRARGRGALGPSAFFFFWKKLSETLGIQVTRGVCGAGDRIQDWGLKTYLAT